MPSLYFDKRETWCYGYSCSGSWVWARWILFALFILGLILVILSALRINKRRGQEGRQPIMGTAWLTPPSYMQSQTQNPPYVPQYSEQTNDNDMGYYDGQGQFHPNPKMREAFGDNAFHLNNLVPDSTGQPSSFGQRTGDNEQHDFQRDFARYYGNTGNPNVSSSGAADTDINTDANNNRRTSASSSSDDIQFQRPQGPPPAHTKN